MQYLKEAGVDAVLLLEFTRELADWSADKFSRQLYDTFAFKHMHVGYDFAFGHDRQGHVDDLRRVKPILETMPGWMEDVTGARSVSDLPEKALSYVRRISELVGRPVEILSVGPDRVQTIFVDKTSLHLTSAC